ncbi:MAG: ribonuclease R [Prevotellaceae bacterium]|jgi:ribonuclease R|nr:ribonuclease R [Prevotellaceae bacterium]
MSKKKQKRSAKDFLEAVLSVFTSNPRQELNYKQVAKQLGVTIDNDKAAVLVALENFAEQNILKKSSRGKYKLTKSYQVELITGVVDMTTQGFAYIESDECEEDIFVSQHNLNHALHGDTVKVNLYHKKRGRPEGEVVEIVERSKQTFVGRMEMNGRFGFLIPDSRQMPYDIFIPADALNGAKNGEKVVGRITDWAKNMKSPVGEIVDVLGTPGDNNVEMHAILAEFELPYKFPEELNRVAEKISDRITTEDYTERRDFREVTTFTIDPRDAKDFDDALSIRQLNENTWEVGVHIADVTHYVKPDSEIDKEGSQRATSVYLVDRTVPMLPERLSNYICSLRPNEEKLCFSAVFEMDDKAAITKQWIGRTVILSKHRFTYEEAQEIIEAGNGDFKDEILALNSLAQKLRAKRFASGSVNFEREEPRFEIDENGKPLSVYFKEFKESNQLIEEFMLLANKKVAEFVGKTAGNKKAKTFVYRIHEKPNEDKFNSFRQFITKFGYKLAPKKEKDISKELNKLLKEVRGKPEANLIETLAVRSMAKARYSTDNIGHYGLAFPYYTHFTSPIRRYPDMMAHRLLERYLKEGKSADKEYYEQQCKHSSAMEIKAAEAERASIKYKMVEFMQDKIGQEFDGVISGVTEWGIYVELSDTIIEGMVSVREMKDDYYYFDEEEYSMVGRSSHKRYTLGDKVRIKVLRANMERKQLDFSVVVEDAEKDFVIRRTEKLRKGKRKSNR